MFSLKKGCGDWVFLAAAILRWLFFYDLLLIIHFSNTFFKVSVVPAAFSAKGVLLGGGEEGGRSSPQAGEGLESVFWWIWMPKRA